MRKSLGYIIFFFILSRGIAQVSVKDSSIFLPMVVSSYAAQLPGGDMAERFGFNSGISLSMLFKTKKNILFGAEGSFIFGNQIREDGILDSISTSAGYIINSEGLLADVRMYERGFTVFLTAGKIIPLWSPNPNSGLMVTGSAGFIQHKIRIEDIGNKSPQLTKEYRKGYDRLSNGPAIKEFIGYVYLGNNRMLNFFGGFEFIQGFTRSRRSWDYDLMQKDTKKRIDLFYGFRVGWILPLYKKGSSQFYFY